MFNMRWSWRLILAGVFAMCAAIMITACGFLPPPSMGDNGGLAATQPEIPAVIKPLYDQAIINLDEAQQKLAATNQALTTRPDNPVLIGEQKKDVKAVKSAQGIVDGIKKTIPVLKSTPGVGGGSADADGWAEFFKAVAAATPAPFSLIPSGIAGLLYLWGRKKGQAAAASDEKAKTSEENESKLALAIKQLIDLGLITVNKGAADAIDPTLPDSKAGDVASDALAIAAKDRLVPPTK